jgi:hypothetical protein
MAPRKTKQPKQLSVYEVETAKALRAFKAGEKSPGLWAVAGKQFHPDCARTFHCVRFGGPRNPITSLSVGMMGGRWKTPHEAAQAVRFAALVEGEEVRLKRERAAAGEPPFTDYLDLRCAAYRAVGANPAWGFTPEQLDAVINEFRARSARLGG